MAWLEKQRQKEIEEAVDSVMTKTKLSYPEDSILDIAQRLGVEVYLSDFGEFENEVSGLIKYPERAGEKPSIYLQKNENRNRRIFTLAHELGHFILHKGSEKLRVDKFDYLENSKEALEETEANFFAASLLVSREKLEKVLSEIGNISEIAGYFGVSESVIKNRIKWLEMN